MLFLLSFGLVNSNGHSFPSKPFQIYSAQEQPSQSDLCKQAATDNPSSYWYAIRLSLAQCLLVTVLTITTLNLAFKQQTSDVCSAMNKKVVADLEPAYHLLIDFSPPFITGLFAFQYRCWIPSSTGPVL